MATGDSDWLTWPQAAELVGCPVPTIDWYSRTGRIAKRPKVGNRPSLKRSSVEEFAIRWRERVRDRGVDAKSAPRRQSASSVTVPVLEAGIRPTRVPALPADSTGWLTTLETADLLEVSRVSVMRLVTDAGCRTERVGHRWWIEERDVRKLAEERTRRCRSQTPPRLSDAARVRSRLR